MSDENHDYLVMQQGGASNEWYASIYDTAAEAWHAIQCHRNATYNALGPYPFPRNLTDEQLGTLLETLQTLCGNVIWEEWPDIPEEFQHEEDEFV